MSKRKSCNDCDSHEEDPDDNDNHGPVDLTTNEERRRNRSDLGNSSADPDIVIIDEIATVSNSGFHSRDFIDVEDEMNNCGTRTSPEVIVLDENPTQKKQKTNEKIRFSEGPFALLEEYAADCPFYLILKSESLNGQIFLGCTEIKCISYSRVKNANVRLYVSEIEGRSFLYIEKNNATDYCIITQYLDFEFFSGLRSLCFTLVSGPSTKQGHLSINIYMNENGPASSKAEIQNRNIVFAYLYAIPHPEYEDVDLEDSDPQRLYNIVRDYHLATRYLQKMIDVQHNYLVPQLRPYQKEAVNWMLTREMKQPATESLHCIYTEITTPMGQLLFYSNLTGHLTAEKPLAKPLPTGGILADEMGLGKTVEVLACILANQRPPEDIRLETDFRSSKVPNNNIKMDRELPKEEFSEPVQEQYFTQSSELVTAKLEAGTNEREFIAKNSTMELEVNCETVKVMVGISEVDSRKCGMTLRSKNALVLSAKHDTKIGCEKDVASSPICATKFVNGKNSDICGANLDSDKGLTLPGQREERTYNTRRPQQKAKGKINKIKKSAKVFRNSKKNETPMDPILETIEYVISHYCYGSKAKGNKAKRKSLLRLSMEKMYEDKLAEMACQPKFVPEVRLSVQCVCGKESPRLSKICCTTCNEWQHMVCVGLSGKLMEMYTCPQCWQLKEPVRSAATLIVAPASIISQWTQEIEKHISDKNFRVTTYRGVRKGFVQPKVLAQNDVVLTTYETLRREIVYVDMTNDPSRLRHAKRFFAQPSPLKCIEWWRICLDEAQMVESHSSKTAEMACHLSAVHRWAITGTPVQKSVQDLFGLLQFLEVEPYNVMSIWLYALYRPYCNGVCEPLHNLMCKLMWRTMKINVLEQLGVPRQRKKIHWLHFSPIEEYFYRKQHMLCSSQFLNKIEQQFPDKNIKLRYIDKHRLSKLLNPLLSLRKACVHHLVVKDFAPDKKTMSLDELQQTLIKKTRNECEELLRQHIAALNGLAAIFIITNSLLKAVKLYKTVLKINDEFKGKLSVDSLQMIHTLHNFSELLEQNMNITSLSLTSEGLRARCSNIENEYTNKIVSQSERVCEQLRILSKDVDDCVNDLTMKRGEWCEEIIKFVIAEGHEEEFLNRVRNDLMDKMTKFEAKSARERLRSMKSIEFHLYRWGNDLIEGRKKCLSGLISLRKTYIPKLVDESVECHLRSYLDVKEKCSLCSCENAIKSYETKLFAVSTKANRHSMVGDCLVLGKVVQTSWQLSEMEQVLRSILTHLRSDRFQLYGKKTLFIEANKHLKLLELLKKEFKLLRVAWMHLFDRVAVYDEVNMAKLRLRIRSPSEPLPVPHKHNPIQQLSSNIVNKGETIHIIEEDEVPAHTARLKAERSATARGIKKKYGMMQYLVNLNRDPDPCPVCRGRLKKKWSVLMCGHYYCMRCIETMFKMNLTSTTKTVKCAVCRETTQCDDISLVNLENETTAGYDVDVKIVGSHSRKVEAIVKTILIIKKEEPNAKAIIFSSWEKVLEILRTALVMNGINVRHLQPGNRFQQCLTDFKNKDLGVDVLLLSVHTGSKGLNLTEANHVLLAEPILNPADELQAVGRVHRIGQEKETYVHKFLMRGTIEEKIHRAMRRGHGEWSDDSITLKNLMKLFTDA